MCFLPPRARDIDGNEIGRAFKAHGSTIEPISFVVPRKVSPNYAILSDPCVLTQRDGSGRIRSPTHSRPTCSRLAYPTNHRSVQASGSAVRQPSLSCSTLKPNSHQLDTRSNPSRTHRPLPWPPSQKLSRRPNLSRLPSRNLAHLLLQNRFNAHLHRRRLFDNRRHHHHHRLLPLRTAVRRLLLRLLLLRTTERSKLCVKRMTNCATK